MIEHSPTGHKGRSAQGVRGAKDQSGGSSKPDVLDALDRIAALEAAFSRISTLEAENVALRQDLASMRQTVESLQASTQQQQGTLAHLASFQQQEALASIVIEGPASLSAPEL